MYDHLRYGCQKCGFFSGANKSRKSIDTFIAEAKNLYGDKQYDFSLVEYISADKNVTITCKSHNITFTQVPHSFLRGRTGCPKCITFKRSTSHKNITREMFIEKANNKYKCSTYDYNDINYVNGKTDITICCTLHGNFVRKPIYFLNGSGCTTCAIEFDVQCTIHTVEDFKKKAIAIHGDLYDYSIMTFVNLSTKIKIQCKKNMIFFQQPKKHIYERQGCPYCWGKIADTQTFVEYCAKVHNGLYDYSLVKYTDKKTNIEIICAKHGSFFQIAGNHYRGSGCRKCRQRYSKVQIEWLNLLENMLGVKIDHAENTEEFLIKGSRYHADGYCEEKNTIFEFNGCYFHVCTIKQLLKKNIVKIMDTIMLKCGNVIGIKLKNLMI